MLLEALIEKDMGITICPWGYLFYSGQENVLDRVRRLHSAGVKTAMGSDDPAYMEDVWLSHSLYLLRVTCRFTNDDFVKLQRNAIEVRWAPEDTKTSIINELKLFSADFKWMKKEARAITP
jgi:adenosine deaminase